MALAHSPKISTDGLTFAYDMGNTKKSWKSAPTTNLYTDGNFALGVTHPVNGGGTVIADPTNPFRKVIKFNPSAGTQYHGRDITAVVSTIYSLQMEIYVSVDFNGTSVMMYPEQGGSGAGVSYDLTKKGTWQTLKYNGKAATTTNIRMLAYVLSAFTTGFVLATNIQVEQNAFATQFVNGTRSNTQVIIDLMGTNTITASSLTYAADNTFSFNYDTPNYITVPLATSLNKIEGTMNFWLYPTRYSGGNGYFVNRETSEANAPDWFWIGPYSDTFYFRIGNGTDCCSNDLSFGSVSTIIPLNNWINMCFTWKSNGTSAIYKNGVLITSRAIGNIPATHPAVNGRIGLGHNNGPSYYDGKIPTVQMYNRQFTAMEVLQNFNALRGRYGV